MWLSYHIPCFYINRGSACACNNQDFKEELLKGLEKEGVTYIKLETVKVKMGDDFVDEEILSFYTDDKIHMKNYRLSLIFLMMQLISMSQI